MMRQSVVVGVGMALLLCGCSREAAVTIDSRPLVRVGTVVRGIPFADTLSVQGTVRTKNAATISARMPGAIDEILVEEGDRVQKGTVLFRVDQVNLFNAVRAAEDDLRLARAKLVQVEVQGEKAHLDAARMKRLFESRAVTKDQWERADVAEKTAVAAQDAAKAAVTKAETGLSVARKNFSDSAVCAPFDGIVTHKYKDMGDYVGPGVPVFGMDDPETYEVAISLNAERYARVVEGATEVVLPSTNGTPLVAKVSYKSPRVNPATRTFEIRAVIAKTDALAPGMIADCQVVFARRQSQAVPVTAIALRGGTDALFKVVEGKVVRVPVEAGLTQGGLREVRSPELSDEDAIIVEGMLLVNEGDEVRVSHVSE